MANMPNMSPEDRVSIIVGGKFTADGIGQAAYDQIISAVAADPTAHMTAFEQLFLTGRPNRNAITDMHLVSFLTNMRQHLPDRVTAAAQRLNILMTSLARHQESEAAEVESERGRDEIDRQRSELQRQRAGLDQLLRRA